MSVNRLIQLFAMFYIHQFCAISSAGIIEPSSILFNWEESSDTIVKEPNYGELIPIMQLRRMTKPIKWGVACIKKMLPIDSDISTIHAINVGTAYGLLTDSESFVNNLVEQNEQMLNPTAFIQSTHNTVGGQIALSLKCHAHNMTFVHKGHSFEQALLDIELLEAPTTANFIVGGIDEITSSAKKVINSIDTKENWVNEGAAFFCMSKIKQVNNVACLAAYTFQFFQLNDNIDNWITAFFTSNIKNTNCEEVLILDGSVEQISNHLFHTYTAKNYKNYVGNYPTVSAVAVALGINQLQQYPTIFIINQYYNYWSLYVLKR